MNAFLTVLPIFLIRYGLLGAVNKEALKRAGLFAPLIGREKLAYWIYQITTLVILVYLLFLKIDSNSAWFYTGLILYGLGIFLYAVSVINFAKPGAEGMNKSGLYRISRNPMYIAYFIALLGCVLLAHSWILMILLIIFQLSSHWIIISEERWCINEFGEEYLVYMKKVRRYI